MQRSTAKPGYSPGGYRNKLRATRNRVLLVEGPSDKQVFRLLFREAAKAVGGKMLASVTIDTAELLSSVTGDEPGNSARIEAVCRGMKAPDRYLHFVAFVDREYRRFDALGLSDDIPGHRVEGRLVWSRGHSVENYLFDPETLTDVIAAVADTESVDTAVALFCSAFDGGLRVACALGRTAHDLGFARLVAGSVEAPAIRLRAGTAELNTAAWREILASRAGGIMGSSPDRFVASYDYWSSNLAEAPQELVRWMAHGHIGLTVLRAVYGRCVEETSKNRSECRRALRAGTDAWQGVAALTWAKLAVGEAVEYPRVVLEMLATDVIPEPQPEHIADETSSRSHPPIIP